MTFTFDAILPTFIASVIAAISAAAHLFYIWCQVVDGLANASLV